MGNTETHINILNLLKIAYEIAIVSAHTTRYKLFSYAEDSRLIKMMNHNLTKHAHQSLKNLFSQDDELNPIIKLKLDVKSFQIGKLTEIFTDKKIMKQSGNKIWKQTFDVMPERNMVAIRSKVLHREDDRKNYEKKLIWEYHLNNH